METDPGTGAIIICALRYCMGRRTYMPSLVIDWAKRHWDKLSPKDRVVIFRDISEAIQSRDLGDKCDAESWGDFHNWIWERQDVKYLDPTTATPAQLQPRVRLYTRTEIATYVAQIGMVDDWAAYQGYPMSSFDEVADYGNKMREEEAVLIFPICKEAGLSYRH